MIRGVARQLKALGAPVLLRWFGEINLGGRTGLTPARQQTTWPPGGAFTTSSGEQARPTCAGCGAGPMARATPGGIRRRRIIRATHTLTGYVPMVTTGPPNFPGRAGDHFKRSLTPFYRWGRSSGKPMVIGEFGTVEGAPGAKAAWFAQAERTIRTQFPGIRAIVYFESNHQNFGRYFNWRVTSSRSALAAFARSLTIPTSVPSPRPEPPTQRLTSG